MKEGTIEYHLSLKRNKKDPKYSTTFSVSIRTYNEESLESIQSCLGLVDTGLVKRLFEDVKQKALLDTSQDLVTSGCRQLLPPFQEENPVTNETPHELTSDQEDLKL